MSYIIVSFNDEQNLNKNKFRPGSIEDDIWLSESAFFLQWWAHINIHENIDVIHPPLCLQPLHNHPKIH